MVILPILLALGSVAGGDLRSSTAQSPFEVDVVDIASERAVGEDWTVSFLFFGDDGDDGSEMVSVSTSAVSEESGVVGVAAE